MSSYYRCAGVLAMIAVVFFLVPNRGAAQGRGPNPAVAAALAAAAEKPTPHNADGHPDLNGYWEIPNFTPTSFYQDEDTKTTYLFGKNGGKPNGGPGGRGTPLAATDPNLPPYKPELQEQVNKLAATADTKDWADPSYKCRSLGVPRIGAPKQIVQAPGLVVLLYQTDGGSGTVGGTEVRLVPTDGRPHRTDTDPSYLGDSIGHWEGDTLVVDANRFNTDTWLGSKGYFHTKALHVVERLTRKGDTLQYEAKVEDPGVLTKAWNPPGRTLMISKNMVTENPPCQDLDMSHLIDSK